MGDELRTRAGAGRLTACIVRQRRCKWKKSRSGAAGQDWRQRTLKKSPPEMDKKGRKKMSEASRTGGWGAERRIIQMCKPAGAARAG